MEIKDDTISRQAALDAIERTRAGKAAFDAIKALPSTQGDAEFISWLLDEIWDEEMWELNCRAFPEVLCRRLVRLGYLKEEGGKYVRLK